MTELLIWFFVALGAIIILGATLLAMASIYLDSISKQEDHDDLL